MLASLANKITLSRRQVGAGSFGQDGSDFIPYASNIWAGASVRRSLSLGTTGLASGIQTIYTIRYRKDVEVGDRLTDGDDTFAVVDLRPYGQRSREWLEIGVS